MIGFRKYAGLIRVNLIFTDQKYPNSWEKNKITNFGGECYKWRTPGRKILVIFLRNNDIVTLKRIRLRFFIHVVSFKRHPTINSAQEKYLA